MKNILFIASEAVPFIKTGGLADVVGSLPKCFDKQYFDVRVMIPKYLCIKESFRNEMKYVNHFYMDYLGQNRYVGILEYEYEGVTFYFIDNESYFWGDRPYGDWYYDLEKFSFFCKAALSSLPVIGFKPDVIHCHDWQTGLIPVHLKDKFHGGEFFRDIKSVMTIHNLKFQGVWDVKTIQHFSELPDYYFTPDKLEAYKDGNMLKGGIVYADAITTVSNTYAEEIKTPFYGEGLDGLMRARSNSLRGILNGIDYDEFNPETDKRIVQNYNAKTFRKEKSKNKKALQAELGLAQDEKKFMIGIVSRLTDQKGLDLVQCVMDEICTEDVQLVVLGTGDERYENMFRHYDWKYNDRVSANIYYSEDKELLVKEVQTAQSESGTTDCKLLVIDDNEEIRNILVDIFSPLYTVETASDGEEGYEKVKMMQPDLVISDIMMPGMPGTELCAKIKNNIETCHIPVVLLTALSAPERELEGLRIGADIYVVKPFNMRRLVMQCNNLINTRRLLQNKYAHQLDSKAEKIATNELDQRFIEQATQVVEDNMENPEFSVDVFSREMGVGRTVLFQKIKGITGSTPNNFIMNLRLKKAAYFLQNSPEMNISDIAYRLGFGNPQYFNKCFKELFDIAPTQYRKAHNTSSEPSVK